MSLTPRSFTARGQWRESQSNFMAPDMTTLLAWHRWPLHEHLYDRHDIGAVISCRPPRAARASRGRGVWAGEPNTDAPGQISPHAASALTHQSRPSGTTRVSLARDWWHQSGISFVDLELMSLCLLLVQLTYGAPPALTSSRTHPLRRMRSLRPRSFQGLPIMHTRGIGRPRSAGDCE